MKRDAATLKKKKEGKEVRRGTYVDALSDFGFKRIFGQEPHKDLLIDFLNELLKSRGKQIVDLHYNKNESVPLVEGGRTSIYDLTCTDKNGEQFIIEVQRARQEYFKDRTVLYVSNVISELAQPGPASRYKLPEIYFIGLLDFTFKDSDPDTYLHRVHLREEESGKIFYDKLSFTFIEIPSFIKGEEELETGLDKWLYVLKNLSTLKKIPVILSKTIFQKVFTIAELSKLSKEDYMRYTKEQMARIDRYAILETAKKEGREEGREEGIEIGEEKIIRKLLESGKFSVAEVALYADVSASVVQKVKTSMKKD